ncbi:MAG: ArsA family ATPase [Spirochaetales bacterium]|nr:ArsA family ATPase [Spirochaetales bacterium]
MRIILYTGKGGVGKTSIAAATACRLADDGNRVLVMSTDQAHSLRDSFRVKLGNDPVAITENLAALEIDTGAENERLWGSLKGYMEAVFFLKADQNISNEELLVFPGFEELVALLRINEIEKEGMYDYLIVDCAPTGETLSLLKFPDMFKYWINKVLPIKRKATKVIRPVTKKIMGIPLPEDQVFDDFENIFGKLDELHLALTDREKTSIRIVTTPEKIVIAEAQRNFSCMHLFDFNVDAFIVNKIIPPQGMDGYFGEWMKIQEKNLATIREDFSPIPIFHSELLDHELCGIGDLRRTGRIIYRDQDPGKVLWTGKIYDVLKEEENYRLRIHIPHLDKSELNMYQRGNEISISIRNEKRNFILPRKMENRQISHADYTDDGYLEILFV